jgi:2-polyprenyl-3-methyl-5-hydroxy-6-metoxy-1,4-benzoquinol methylase
MKTGAPGGFSANRTVKLVGLACVAHCPSSASLGGNPFQRQCPSGARAWFTPRELFSMIRTSRLSLWQKPVLLLAVMATEVDPARVMPHAILQAADLRDTRILEVGAGDGRLTFQYASQPRSVIGIDTAELDIKSAVVTPRVEIHGQVHFLCASAMALPFSAEQFEIVLLASSL